MKKIVSVLISLVITCTILLGVIPVNAEETQVQTQPQPTVSNDFSVEGTNSFGNMLSETLDAEADELEENDGCNVFSAEVTGNDVTVSFETNEPCTLLAAIYDEAGVQMLASGTAEVTQDKTEKTVTIETESMPQYFYLKVFLVDTYTLKPICTAYESPNYTQEMQEFFALTVNDFDEELVLNLDENEDNNFAVFSEDTVFLESDGVTNLVTTCDYENDFYVIENADSTLCSLSAGDILSLSQTDGSLVIVQIGDITVDDTNVSITGTNAEMEDIFDIVKIDASQDVGESIVDDSELEEGVTYEGMVSDTENHENEIAASSKAQTYATEAEGKKSMSIKMNIDKIFNQKDGNTIQASVGLSLTFSVKLYISFKYSYLELKGDYSADMSISLNISTNDDFPIKEFKLVKMVFTIVPGINITMTPSFVVEAKASITYNGSYKGTIGFNFNTKTGIKNLTSKPKVENQIKLEGTIFIGFKFKPAVEIISPSLVELSFAAAAGIEIEAEMLLYNDAITEERHTCEQCLSGKISAKYSIELKAELLKGIFEASYEREYKAKIFNFYYSFTEKEFGKGDCPYMQYPVTIRVVDENDNIISGIDITVKNVSNDKETTFSTDNNGLAKIWMNNGDYILSATEDDLKGTKKLTVSDSKKSVKLKLKNTAVTTAVTTTTTVTTTTQTVVTTALNEIADKKVVSFKFYQQAVYPELSRFAAITEDGALYMWGSNEYGALGNGYYGDGAKTRIPVKILDNVKSVSLGFDHTGAITEDGSLYMWGRNKYGQLGNGELKKSCVPVKIMDNVKAVSVGNKISGAITEDGSLYMWGYNGLLGNGESGTDENGDDICCVTPKKIMDNIKEFRISSGYYNDEYCAVITEDGSLYTWGDNTEYQAGIGSYDIVDMAEDTNVPTKILDNVKTIKSGWNYSAAITEDGSLYTWGSNDYGQTGNSYDKYCYWDGSHLSHYCIPEPTKILDNVTDVSLNEYHGGAITEDGSLYMWGYNVYGQVGNGESGYDEYHDGIFSDTPVKIMDNVKAFSPGINHTGAITENGSLYTWGSNNYGQLGNGEFGLDENGYCVNSPIPIKVMDNIKSISFNGFVSSAIDTDGNLHMWGSNIEGILGTPVREYATDLYGDAYCVNVYPTKISVPAYGINQEAPSFWISDAQGVPGDLVTLFVNVASNNQLDELDVRFDWDNRLTVEQAFGVSNIYPDNTEYGYCDIYESLEDIFDGTIAVMNFRIPDDAEIGTVYNMTYSLDSFTTTDGEDISDITSVFGGTITVVSDETETANEILTQSTSLLPQTSYLSLESQTAEYTDLIPNEIYNFYALKTSDTEELLSSENLLYLTQGIADEYGNLTISYIPKEEYADAKLILVGMTRTDISDAYVEVTDLEYTGEEQSPQVTVSLGDEILIEGVDYDIAGDFSATDAGLYEITIVGTGEYTGETTALYWIESAYMTGDISGNDMIDLYDAVEICKYIMGMRDFTDEELLIADYDYSGTVDLYDVIGIARKLLE